MRKRATEQRGRVVKINPIRGAFLLELEGGGFAVFEFLEGVALDVGDEIVGNLGALGRETLTKPSARKRFDAFGQTGPSPRSACEKHI